MPSSSDGLPLYDELAATEVRPQGASWGLFGNDVGTLNLATPTALVRAAQSVRRGVVFSLNLATTEPDPPILGRGALRHHRVDLGNGFDDYYDAFYPQASSQWDSLAHVEHPDHGFYQGYDVTAVTDPVAPALGIGQWAERGIAGRFVLADVAGHQRRIGAPIDPASSFAITAELLDGVLAAQSTTVESGDILLINTGWLSWYLGLDPERRAAIADAGIDFCAPGLDPQESTARWMWDHRIAAAASDCPALERMPFDKGTDDGFLHRRLIPKLGLAIGELFLLDALAADCAEDGRYDGLFCAAPLNTRGGAGSPANALALK